MSALSIRDCRLSIERTTRRAVVLAVRTLVCASLGPGCNKKSVDGPNGAAESVERKVTDGPVTLVFKAPKDLELSKRGEIEIRVTADSGVNVELPDYAQSDELKAHRFEYRVLPRESNAPPQKSGGTSEWHYRYDLDCFLPGEYELPPAKLTYASASADRHELKTDSITISAHALGGKELSTEELAKIPMPAPVELRGPLNWKWLAIAIAALAGALTLVRAWRRYSAAKSERQILVPAHVWADRQFAALIAGGFIEKRMFREFYYRVSGIVRGYLERRFAVDAPEMTTEEFLATTANDVRFHRQVADELRQFLDACDMVKYARYDPQESEARGVLHAARDFVERTRPREETFDDAS